MKASCLNTNNGIISCNVTYYTYFSVLNNGSIAGIAIGAVLVVSDHFAYIMDGHTSVALNDKPSGEVGNKDQVV